MISDWQQALDETVGEIADDTIALRRHFHANPEPSGEELETSLHLYQLLGELELNVQMGPLGCGVIADSAGESPEGRVAFRADIDALRIQDAKKVSYRSTRDGIMHACGHDAHAAMAFATARTLAMLEARGDLPWPVHWRAIFQPAEETVKGARQMIEAKALEGVRSIFALHVDPARRTGEIGVRAGTMTAHCDSICIDIQGQGGHAARPHESKDPLAAAAQLISTLYQFVPRATDSLDAVVVTIGRLRSGQNPNVIPDEAELHGTVRTLSDEVRAKTIDHIRQLAGGMSEITETAISVEIDASIPSVHNDPELTRLVSHAAAEVVGEEHVKLISRPSMGSEDFACYLEHVPGVLFRLGTSSDLALQTGLHTPLFDIDETALAIGTRVMARAVVMACEPEEA